MIYWKVTVKNNQTNEIQIYKTRLGHGQIDTSTIIFNDGFLKNPHELKFVTDKYTIKCQLQ